MSERPLIRLAALGTFPPRGEGSVGARASWLHRRFVVLLLPIAYCLLPIASTCPKLPPQAVLEVPVAEVGELFQGAVCAAVPDIRQGHAVEGVVFAGGVDRQVAEKDQLPDLQGVVKFEIPITSPDRQDGPPRR